MKHSKIPFQEVYYISSCHACLVDVREHVRGGLFWQNPSENPLNSVHVFGFGHIDTAEVYSVSGDTPALDTTWPRWYRSGSLNSWHLDGLAFIFADFSLESTMLRRSNVSSKLKTVVKSGFTINR